MGTLQGPLPIGVILTLLILAYANGHQQCNLQCHGSPGQVFKYEPGTNYRYKLEGTTVTTIKGSDDESAKLSISANADVTAQPNCGYILKLSNVHITGAGGKKFTDAAELESRPIRFGMNNGRLSDDLCVDPSESGTSLNIKRAVISLLQAAATKESGSSSHSETDIFGTCPTSFHYHKSGNSLTVKKTKDLSKCAHREDVHIPLLSSPYVSNSDVQSIPLMDASYESEQQIADGVVKSAKSKEKYKYSPFDEMDSGIKTTVETKLTFVSKGAGVNAHSGNVRRSVIFEASHDKETRGTAEAILAALREACDRSLPIVYSDGAKRYSDIVRAFNRASKEDILQVYAQVKAGSKFTNPDLAKKLFMDSLHATETSARIEVVVELLRSGDITGFDADIWKMVVGFVKHVSPAALKSVSSLLDVESSKHAYLGAGLVGGKFCQDHDCSSSPEIVELEAKLAKPLMAGCKPGKLTKEDLLLASLKGLGNVRHLTPAVAAKLAECASDKSARTRVRAAALDAIRTDPKKPELKTAATEILKNVREDSELRIKAYLVLVECPCGKTAAAIKEILDHEPINQVGAYIVSHLRNLRSSTNPDKALAKHHFGSIITKKRFPFDVRKYSQNFDMSYLLETVNVGASAESDVIYSQESFLPRSVGLNLTTNLFGRSYNWLQMNARFENLERVMERYFGPTGYFNSHDPDEVFSEGQKNYGGFVGNIQKKYGHIRATRSVSRAQLEALEHKVRKDHDHTHDAGPLIDFSLKVDGADVAFVNFHGDGKHESAADNMIERAFGEVNKNMEDAKDINVDYSKNFALIDAHLNYPTGMGLALKLKVLGTVATRLKMDGKVDLNAIMHDPDNTDFRLQIVPSGAIDLSGSISIDGTLVERGVRLGLTLHSATGTDVSLRLLDGKGFDFKLGTPLQKTELINAETEILNFERTGGHAETTSPIAMNEEPEPFEVQFDQLEEVLGVKLVTKLKLTGKNEPFYGMPGSLSLYLEKESDLTAYQAKFFFDSDPHSKNLHIDVLLDTPNTKTNRKMNVMLNMGMEPKPFLKVAAAIPWITANFEGHLIDNPREKMITAKLQVDQSEYSVKAGVKISGQRPTFRYEPFLDYKAPGSPTSGKLIGRKGAKQTAPQGNHFSGAVTVTEEPNMTNKFKLEDLTLHTQSGNFKATGEIVTGKGLLKSDVIIKYDRETVSIKSMIDFTHPGDSHIGFGLILSAYPDFGVTFNWDVKNVRNEGTGDEMYDSVMTLVHGMDPNSDVARITIKNYHSFKDDDKTGEEYVSRNYFSYPLLSLESKLDWTARDKSFSYAWSEKNGIFHLNNEMNAAWSTKDICDYNIHFTGELETQTTHNKYSVDTLMKHELLEEDKSNFVNSIQLHNGDKYELNAVVTHKFDDVDDYHFHVDSHVHLPITPARWNLVVGAKEHKGEMSGLLKFTGGDKHYVDLTYSLTESPDPKGSYSVVLSDILKTNGDFARTPTNFKANWEFDFLKHNKKMDAKADIKLNDPKYTGFVQFCWDTNNREKTFKIETDTLIAENEFYTKNVINFKNKKTQLNLSGKTTGTHNDGTCSGKIEVVLPNTRHVTAAFQTAHVTEPGDHEGEILIEFVDHEKAGANPTKLTFKLIGKNIDWVKNQFDGQGSVIYTATDNRNLLAQATLKKIPNAAGDKWTINGHFDVKGTLVEHPMTTKFESEVANLWLEGELNEDNTFPPLTFQTSGSVGKTHEWSSVGKLNGHLATGEFTVRLPESQPVQHFKWVTTNKIVLPVNENDINSKWETTNNFAWNGNKFFKSSCDFVQEEHGGKVKLEWESDSVAKRSIAFTGHATENAGVGHVDLFVAHDLLEGKHAEMKLEFDLKDDDFFNVHVTGVSHESTKYDVLLKNKLAHSGNGFQTELAATVGKNKYTGNGKFELDEDLLLFDVLFDQPTGRSRSQLKIVKKGEKHSTVEAILKWPGKNAVSFSYNAEFNVASFENMLIKVNVDSPQLNLEKFQFNLATGASAKQPAKKVPHAGKIVTFSGKNAGKNIFSGNMIYNIKEEGTKVIYEGSGNMKIEDKPHPITFKATKDTGTDGDQFNMLITSGKRNFNIDYRKNNDEFKLERTYCKDGKSDCSTGRIHLFRKNDNGEREAKIDLLFDLSLMSRQHHDISFVAHGKVGRDGNEDKSMELQWSPEGKLAYSEYRHNNGAGMTIVTPHRTIEGEVKFEESEKTSDHWSHKLEANFWIDKVRHPDHKLSFTHDMEVKDGHYVCVSTFIHPKLTRPMTVEFKADTDFAHSGNAHALIDVFADASHAIKVDHAAEYTDYGYNSVTTAKSTGCGLDMTLNSAISQEESHHKWSWKNSFVYADSTGTPKKSEFNLIIKDEEYFFTVSVPEAVLYESRIKVLESSNEVVSLQQVDNVLGIVYEQTIKVKKMSKNTMSIVWKLQFSEHGGNKLLQVNADTKSRIIDVDFNHKKLMKIHIKNNAEVDYVQPISDEVLSDLVETAFGELKAWNKRWEHVSENMVARWMKDGKFFSDKCSAALPDFSHAWEDYAEHVVEITGEILSDPLIGALTTELKHFVNQCLENFVTTSERLAEFYTHHLGMFLESLTKLMEVINASLPPVIQSATDVQAVFIGIVEEWVLFANELATLALEQFKEYQDEFRIVVDTVNELMKELDHFMTAVASFAVKVYQDTFQQVYSLAENLVTEINNQVTLNELPSIHDLQLDGMLASLIEETVKDIGDNCDSHFCKFVTTLGDYLTKFLRQEPFNVDEAVEVLTKLWEESSNELMQFTAGVHWLDIVESQVQSALLSSDWSPVKVPKGDWRFSVLEWLLSHDIPTFDEILTNYNIFNILDPWALFPPFSASGVIIGGGEVITFDGKHVALKGTCSYLLAEDYAHDRFSLVADIEAGKLKTVTLFNQHHSIEIRPNKKPLLDGKETEYLVLADGIKAWRNPSGYGMYSDAGVLVECDEHFSFCVFKVSGFYHNHVKGLLGNPNYEPYDDTTTLHNTIARDNGEFQNSWKVNDACPSVPPMPDVKPPREKYCTNFFSESDQFDGSNLQLCFYSVPPEPFREACDNMVSHAANPEAKRAAACKVASAYAQACRQRGNPFSIIPDECVVCHLGNEKLNEGGIHTITTPGKMADVVYVVELNKQVEGLFRNLLVPLTNTIKNDYKDQGINDVRFTVVGYGGAAGKWPAYFTNNGQMEFTGQADHIKFADLEHAPANNTLPLKTIETAINELFGNTPKHGAHESILQFFNFRPEAVKTVIGLDSNICAIDEVLSVLRTLFNFKFYEAMGITTSYIYPFKVNVEDQKSAFVVGFDDDHVYTLADSKSKPLKGLHHKADDLEYERPGDACVFYSKNSGGNVFAGGNFAKAQPAQKNKFMTVMSQMIVDTSMKTVDTLECTCAVTLDFLRPKTYCVVEDTKYKSKDKAAIKIKGGGVKG